MFLQCHAPKGAQPASCRAALTTTVVKRLGLRVRYRRAYGMKTRPHIKGRPRPQHPPSQNLPFWAAVCGYPVDNRWKGELFFALKPTGRADWI
jgi:hypothetical protein